MSEKQYNKYVYVIYFVFMTPSIIGIAGISGSGKSSASQDIAFKLARDGYKVAVMFQDDYFLNVNHHQL